MTRSTPVAPRAAKPRDPSNPVDRTPRTPGSVPAEEAEEHLELPHERDESLGSTAQTPDPSMRQAQRDLQEGQVDTDMRVPPGLDAERRARYVPGAGGQHPSQDKPAASPPPGPRKGAPR